MPVADADSRHSLQSTVRLSGPAPLTPPLHQPNSIGRGHSGGPNSILLPWANGGRAALLQGLCLFPTTHIPHKHGLVDRVVVGQMVCVGCGVFSMSEGRHCYAAWVIVWSTACVGANLCYQAASERASVGTLHLVRQTVGSACLCCCWAVVHWQCRASTYFCV